MTIIPLPHRGRRVTTVEGPDPIDIHVGSRVRLRRMLLGLSQVDFSAMLGPSFQQIQKYESGANRISASMLYRMADALDVPVAFFYDDMPDVLRATRPSEGAHETAVRRQGIDLMRAYIKLPPYLRSHINEIIQLLAKIEVGEE